MAENVKNAKGFEQARRYAQQNSLPGGTLQVDVLKCNGLPAADASGKCDPSVRLTFSKLHNQQHAATDNLSQTINPVYKSKNKFKFNVVAPADTLQIEVFDHDYFPLPKRELIARCSAQVGDGTAAGTDGDITLHLHGPKKGDDACDGYTPGGGHGTITLRVYYDYNESANTHASVDLTAEDEEFAWGKCKDAIMTFSVHLSYACVPLYYWLDTCMWVRPFESLFWMLFWTVSTFFFENLLSAFFPGLMFILLGRKYISLVRHGFKGPPQDEDVPVMGWKETLHMTQTNLAYYNGLFDYWNEIYSWQRRSITMFLMKFFGAWTVLVIFFPWFPSFRYWWWFMMIYMYTLYPLYINYPRLMAFHSAKIAEWSSMFTLRHFELTVKPSLPAPLANLIPLSEGAKIVAQVEMQLPPIPDRPMDYNEWKYIHGEREGLRHRLELRESGFLDEKGRPACDARNGKLIVKIVSASHLKAADAGGTSDPYVKLKIGSRKHKTEVKDGTIAPVWNEEFLFREVGYLSGVLSMSVMDHNKFLSDQSLGTCQVKLETVVRDVDRTMVLPLAGTGPDATIALTLRGEGAAWPKERDSEILQKLAEARREAKASLLKGPPDSRNGVLRVKLCYGSGLRVCDTRSSDPYAVLCIVGHPSQQNPHRSAVINSTLAPVWNELFKFQNVTAHQSLLVKVYDKDRIGNDDFMGEGTAPLRDLFEGEADEVEINLVDKGKQYGFIVVSLLTQGFGRVMATPALSTASPPPMRQGGALPGQPQPSILRQRSNLAPLSGVPGASGQLMVLVQEAKGLQASRPDPAYYVKVKLVTPTEHVLRFKTRPVNPGTHNPMWSVRQAFSSLPPDTLTTHRLHVEVWDQQPDQAVCLASGEFPDLPKLGTVKSLGQWVPVFQGGARAGEVRINVEATGIP